MESYTDILQGHERSGCGFETISFLTIVKEGGIRRRAMCSFCLQAKDRIKVVNSAIVHNTKFKFIGRNKIKPNKSKAVSFTTARVKDPLNYSLGDQNIPVSNIGNHHTK